MTINRIAAFAGGCLIIAGLAYASLFPVDWQVRTGLHWLVEHFLLYFAITGLVCLAWPRPAYVAATLMTLAALLEALQGLTADRIPDLATAISGASGVLLAAILFQLMLSLRKRGRDGPKSSQSARRAG